VKKQKDEYIVQQFANMFEDYFREVGLTEKPSPEEMQNMLMKDKKFHKWWLKRSGYVWVYTPLYDSWACEER
jgi:hypothetical protein